MTMLRCDAIEATAATQIRKKLDKHLIDEFSDAIKAGAIFPKPGERGAMVVFAEANSERYILADGFHRLYAHIHAGVEEVDVEIREGDPTDALMYALGANEEHGLRRSKADRRRAIEIALSHPTIGQMTRQEIADICHVSKRSVQRVANQKVIDDPKPGPNDGGESKPPTDEDHRPSPTPDVTQEQVERDELRAALKLIKALPYDGAMAHDKLELDPDDFADCEYVSTWLASVVVAHHNAVDADSEARNRVDTPHEIHGD